MPKSYSPDTRLKAKVLWLAGHLTDTQIAAQLGIARPGTILDWRNEEGWEREREAIQQAADARVTQAVMETIAAITILVPVLLPLMDKIGVDPVHFGLVMVLNLMIGLLTPPVGMVLYILARVSGISFERTTKACLPFLIPLLISLALVTYWPAMVMFLPNLFYK